MKKWQWSQRVRHWWLRRRYMQIRLLNPNYTEYQASRQTLERMLVHLDYQRFGQFAKSDGIGQELRVFYKTIDEYRQEMKALSGRLLNEQMIQTAWADQTEKAVMLDQFLCTKDGFYLDVMEAVNGFKQEALILCALMQKSDEAKFGVHEHNRRMMSKFIANLRLLTMRLIDVSHTLSPQA